MPDEEVKAATANTQVVEGDEEAELLERLARREERRQKRLQEALERQRELDPTITDGRAGNDATEEKEGKSESRRRERYEVEETEVVTKSSYQKNDWRDATEEKKKEEDQGKEEEEKPKRGSIRENQVEVPVEEENAVETREEMPLKNGQVRADEPDIEDGREHGAKETALNEKAEEEEERERARAERLRLEAEERERVEAEQARKLAEEEKARREEEEKAAARERERREAEERERAEEEARRAAEEEAARQRAKAEEAQKAKLEEQNRAEQLGERKIQGGQVEENLDGKWVREKKGQEEKPQTAAQKKQVRYTFLHRVCTCDACDV